MIFYMRSYNPDDKEQNKQAGHAEYSQTIHGSGTIVWKDN